MRGMTAGYRRPFGKVLREVSRLVGAKGFTSGIFSASRGMT
jgi:hypothetical protein